MGADRQRDVTDTKQGDADLERRLCLLSVPANAGAILEEATASRRAGDPARAQIWLRRGIATEPRRPGLFATRGLLSLTFPGERTAPVDDLRRALLLDPTLWDVGRRLASVYAIKGRVTSADRCSRFAMIAAASSPANVFKVAVDRTTLLVDHRPACARQALWAAVLASEGRELRIEALVDLTRRLDAHGDHHGSSNRTCIAGDDTGGDSEAGRSRRAAMRRVCCLWPGSLRATLDTARRALETGETELSGAVTTGDWLRRGEVINPRHPPLQGYIGLHREAAGDLEGAVRAYRLGVIVTPPEGPIYHNMGVALRGLVRHAEALRMFRRAVATTPDSACFRYNLALLQLAFGEVDSGLSNYEHRWWEPRPGARQAGAQPTLDLPFWDGGPGEGPVLVWGEQGVGDEIWFSGYLDRAAARRSLIVECDSRIEPLFTRAWPDLRVVPTSDPPHPDVAAAREQVPIGSLPYLSHHVWKDRAVPAPSGYFIDPSETGEAVPKAAETTRRSRDGALIGGPVIGISWRSTKPDPTKSFEAPIESWGPLFGLASGRFPQARFISLQYGAVAADVAMVRDLYGVELEAIDNSSIEAISSALVRTDIVVSVANSTVMLAHAFGKPCHVVLRDHQEDWRFARGRSIGDWLPGARLYWPAPNTVRDGHWGEQIGEVADFLATDPETNGVR